MYYMIGYDKCSTCLKALAHLKEKGITVTFLDVKKNPPSFDIVMMLLSRVENKEKMWNTSGKLYRELDIKNKKLGMSDEEMAKLLSEEGMLLKRPILYNDEKVIIGYKKVDYDNL